MWGSSSHRAQTVGGDGESHILCRLTTPNMDRHRIKKWRMLAFNCDCYVVVLY